MDVSTQPQIFFLILRRNEAERKHSAKKIYNTFFTPPIFIRHARYQRVYLEPTNFSISKKNYKLPISFLFFFLSFCIFLLFFQRLRNRASTGLGLRANFCTIFLVRTCLKLPSPGHALRICLRHHFWTGLARLFRTIGIWMLGKTFFLSLKFRFLFSS